VKDGRSRLPSDNLSYERQKSKIACPVKTLVEEFAVAAGYRHPKGYDFSSLLAPE